MDLRLSPHREELLRQQLARGRYHSAEEVIELALEAMVAKPPEMERPSEEIQREAVQDMLDFVKRNRVRLGPGVSVKDLIREGHRV
jgi:Arc/MetJ-type ribon-helix-helix transcriptional regulator